MIRIEQIKLIKFTYLYYIKMQYINYNIFDII